MKPKLTIDILCSEANALSLSESQDSNRELYGVTDGKAIGTYLEHKFRAILNNKYSYVEGNSASGIDFPELEVDMKVTKITQPQSSCPFKSAKQKIYGLGYSLLVFVYDKSDNPSEQMGTLTIHHVAFVEKYRTADFQTTSGIRRILEADGNIDDIVAFLMERHLPVDDVQAYEIAEEIVSNPPDIGYLTISNALQWRLQYGRVIEKAGEIKGINKVF